MFLFTFSFSLTNIVPDWDSKKHRLPLKSKLCAFGNIKKYDLISKSDLLNRIFSLKLKNPFPKSMFCQKSRIVTVLSNKLILSSKSPNWKSIYQICRKYFVSLVEKN